jgi:lipoprotein
MKKEKILFILALVGILLAGCKGKEARVQKQLGLGSK